MMSRFSELVASQVFQATCLLSVSALLMLLLLKVIKNANEQTRILAWSFVLLQGWLLFVIQIEIPWLAPEPQASTEIGVLIEGPSSVRKLKCWLPNQYQRPFRKLTGRCGYVWLGVQEC